MSVMSRRFAVIVVVTATLVSAAPRLGAWSFEAHQFITGRALDLLPAAIKPFFDKHREYIVAHAIDPDLWRNAGFEEEPPRHFVDMDAYGPPPFSALPHDFNAAVAQRGKDFVLKNGTLPWRGQEFYDKLVKSFTDVKAGRPYALENATFYVAILSHYVGDAHVPFHAATNYDGQLTNQHGIHARFESELFDRVQPSLKITPRAPAVLSTSAREFLFETLATSFGSVQPLLDADKAAIGDATEYDDAYFSKFERGARPILEARLSNAITAVASLVITAWEQAGKPDLPVNPVRTVRKRRVTP